MSLLGMMLGLCVTAQHLARVVIGVAPRGSQEIFVGAVWGDYSISWMVLLTRFIPHPSHP